MTDLMWELNPRLSVHEADTLPTELMRFYICQARFEPTTFRTTVWHSTNWAIGRTDRIWVQEYNLIYKEKMLKIVGQRITSCACALLKIKSTKIISSSNLQTHRIMLMTTNEQDLNESLMHPNRWTYYFGWFYF